MRMFTLILLAAIAAPSFASDPIKVDQLEPVLASLHGKPDKEAAKQLSALRLSQRLSADKLSRWQAEMPGPASRQALLAIADVSAFLDLPAEEVPATQVPDVEAQRRMIALTVDYVTKTIHQLPNLLTTRVTTSFQDDPWRYEKAEPRVEKQDDAGQHDGAGLQRPVVTPFHVVGINSAGVIYRKGKEVVRPNGASMAPQGLTTSGEFGPILGTAMLDAARSKLAWSHWEQGQSGPIAVYHYAVPAEKSHYEVQYCCIWRADGNRVLFEQFCAYEGEIAVDPFTGTILRLTLRATLKPTDPLAEANLLVEYGAVEMGGKTYFCPTRGVAVSLGQQIQPSMRGAGLGLGLMQTSLNDVVFEQYHVFRAESRMLTPDN